MCVTMCYTTVTSFILLMVTIDESLNAFIQIREVSIWTKEGGLPQKYHNQSHHFHHTMKCGESGNFVVKS